MEWIAKIFFKRREQAELNEDAGKAAYYYLKEKGSPANTVERMLALNYLASGFAMGYRRCEEKYGIRKK